MKTTLIETATLCFCEESNTSNNTGKGNAFINLGDPFPIFVLVSTWHQIQTKQMFRVEALRKTSHNRKLKYSHITFNAYKSSLTLVSRQKEFVPAYQCHLTTLYINRQQIKQSKQECTKTLTTNIKQIIQQLNQHVIASQVLQKDRHYRWQWHNSNWIYLLAAK